METRTAIEGDLKNLVSIARRWFNNAEFEKFGLDRHFETGFADLAELISGPHKDLILLIVDGQSVGFIGMTSFMSPLGKNFIANEHYMYVLPKHRGRGGMILLNAAKEWAKENHCTHLMMNASNLASKLHGKVCKLYEHMGMTLFESSFLCQL